MPKLETWYRVYLSKNFMMGGSWAENAAGYWAERHRPNVLVLSFRAMKRDLRGTVTAVAAFLGISASDALIDDVCRLSSFEHEAHRLQVSYGENASLGRGKLAR